MADAIRAIAGSSVAVHVLAIQGIRLIAVAAGPRRQRSICSYSGCFARGQHESAECQDGDDGHYENSFNVALRFRAICPGLQRLPNLLLRYGAKITTPHSTRGPP